MSVFLIQYRSGINLYKTLLWVCFSSRELSHIRTQIYSLKPQMSRAHEIKKGPIKKSQWVKCFSEIEASITVEKKREIGRIRFSFC